MLQKLVFNVSTISAINTHVLSFFVKFLMSLLMRSRGKSSHINVNAPFNSLIVRTAYSKTINFLQRESEFVWILLVGTRNMVLKHLSSLFNNSFSIFLT